VVEVLSGVHGHARRAEVLGDLLGQRPQLDVGLLRQPFEQG
jgi:hypothetical protein